MSDNAFNLRDELASRIYVDAIKHARTKQDVAPDERAALQRSNQSLERTLSHEALEQAQAFVDAVCHERNHDFRLHHYLEGHAPSAPGRSSGAPRGMYECIRCGHQEERSGQ